MAFQIPAQPYSGKIGTTTIGTAKGAIALGGGDSYPFYLFEGSMPNPPRIAMEVWDYDPSNEWTPAAQAPFKDVLGSPPDWAKKCVNEYGADLIVLQLKSTDPNGQDRAEAAAAAVVKKVADAIEVPLVVWGTANNQKDEAVLKKVSELCQGKNLAIGPVEEANHKGIGASALGYSHVIIGSSPIDVNLAKQLNILLSNLGVAMNKLLIDPTTGGLGYGLEYSYSVMERIMMAALTQEDEKLQVPMICNVGNEIWKSKEAGQPIANAPTLGDPERRGVMMEVVAAVCYLLAGASIVILRHPESVRLVRSFVALLSNGGSAGDVAGISKNLDLQEADLLSLSPDPVLDFADARPPAAAAPAQKAEPKKEEPKPKPAQAAPPKAEKKPVAAAPAEAPKQDPAALAAKAEAEKKAKAEAEARAEAKAKEEAAAKAEAEAKAKSEAEAKAKAEVEAKKKAEEEARVKAKAKEQEDLKALREKRAQEKPKQTAADTARESVSSAQMTVVDRLIRDLDRMHRRG